MLAQTIEAVSDDNEQTPNAEGEAYLKMLMANAAGQKKRRVLEDTHKQLDRLQRSRMMG